MGGGLGHRRDRRRRGPPAGRRRADDAPWDDPDRPRRPQMVDAALDAMVALALEAAKRPGPERADLRRRSAAPPGGCDASDRPPTSRRPGPGPSTSAPAARTPWTTWVAAGPGADASVPRRLVGARGRAARAGPPPGRRARSHGPASRWPTSCWAGPAPAAAWPSSRWPGRGSTGPAGSVRPPTDPSDVPDDELVRVGGRRADRAAAARVRRRAPGRPSPAVGGWPAARRSPWPVRRSPPPSYAGSWRPRVTSRAAGRPQVLLLAEPLDVVAGPGLVGPGAARGAGPVAGLRDALGRPPHAAAVGRPPGPGPRAGPTGSGPSRCTSLVAGLAGGAADGRGGPRAPAVPPVPPPRPRWDATCPPAGGRRGAPGQRACSTSARRASDRDRRRPPAARPISAAGPPAPPS